MHNIRLTEKEAELIRAIRNYKRSCPPSLNLLYFAQQLFDELTDFFGDESEEKTEDEKEP